MAEKGVCMFCQAPPLGLKGLKGLVRENGYTVERICTELLQFLDFWKIFWNLEKRN